MNGLARIAAGALSATFIALAGCRGSGGRSSHDMSEWEVPEQRTRTVTTTTPQPGAPDSVEQRTVTTPPAGEAVGGKSASLYSLVGRPCRVQFRRDALGMAVTAPLPPTSEGVGGRPAYLEGVLTAVNESWVTLSRSDVTYNIPNEAILLIESRD